MNYLHEFRKEDPRARIAALLLLATRMATASTATVRKVSKMMHEDPDRVVRIMCCHAFRWAPTDVAVPELVRVFRRTGEFASVRKEAMEALSYHPRSAVPSTVVVAGLSDASSLVRFFAAYTAGELTTVRARRRLQQMAECDNGYTRFGRVRTAAKQALRQLSLANSSNSAGA